MMKPVKAWKSLAPAFECSVLATLRCDPSGKPIQASRHMFVVAQKNRTIWTLACRPTKKGAGAPC